MQTSFSGNHHQRVVKQIGGASPQSACRSVHAWPCLHRCESAGCVSACVHARWEEVRSD